MHTCTTKLATALLTLILLATGSTCIVQAAPVEVGSPLFNDALYKEPLAEAHSLARQFKYKEASDLLEKSIQRDKKSYDVEMYLGYLMLKQGRFQKSLEHYTECTFIDPHNTRAQFKIAGVYDTMGRFADAIMVLNQIIKKHPFSRDAAIAGGFKQKIAGYREYGDPYSASYGDDEFEEKFLRSDFPLNVAIWVDPGLKKFKPVFEAAVKDAFTQWRNASGGYLRFNIVPNQKDARIVCKMLSYKRDDRDSLLGQTKYEPSFSIADTLKFSRVEVYFEPDRDPSEIAAVTLHEVGHALGLPHSANTRDIMFPTANETYLAILSKRDINSIRKLYGIKPGEEMSTTPAHK